MDTWLTVEDAASYAKVSEATIYRAIALRQLQYTRIGGRKVIRLRPEWIDHWLEQDAVAPLARHGGETVHQV